LAWLVAPTTPVNCSTLATNSGSSDTIASTPTFSTPGRPSAVCAVRPRTTPTPAFSWYQASVPPRAVTSARTFESVLGRAYEMMNCGGPGATDSRGAGTAVRGASGEAGSSVQACSAPIARSARTVVAYLFMSA